MSKHGKGSSEYPEGYISRRRLVRGLGAAVTVPSLLGYVLDSFAQTKISTLVVAVQEGDDRTLDPQDAYEISVTWFLQVLYDRLVTFRGSDVSKVVGSLATNWTVSPDGLTYVFNLNPKAKFSDGKPVTADDVVFSLRRQKYVKGPAAWFQDGVTSVDKLGPRQVAIKLSAPNTDWLYLLTAPYMSIGEASIIKANGGDDSLDAATRDKARPWLDKNSAGSGPFVLETWERGSQLTLKRNPNFWGKASPFERVVFRFEKDPNVQRSLLVRGDAHIALNLTPDLAADLQHLKVVGILSAPSLGFPWLALHVNRNPALKTPKSWEAIRYALDYDGMAKIYQTGGQFIAGCIPTGLPNALPMSERIKQDIPRAKAALAAAGLSQGFAFEMSYGAERSFENIPARIVAEKIKQDLAGIGVTANLHPLPQTQEITDFRVAKLEATIHYWGIDYVGWTDYLPLFAPGGLSARHQGWMPSFSPDAKRIADLTTEATKTPDPKKQQQLCLEAQRLMNQVGPYVWLFETNRLIGYRKDIIKTLTTNPASYIDAGQIDLY